MLNDLPRIIIICLLCTIIIEVTVALILKIKDKKDILNIILVNVFTNPIVVTTTNLMLIFYGKTYRYISLIMLELLVVFTEGLIYKKVLKFNKINGYLLSLILNLCSYLLGLIIGIIIL